MYCAGDSGKINPTKEGKSKLAALSFGNEYIGIRIQGNLQTPLYGGRFRKIKIKGKE